jgi:hypothetical protein
MGIYGYCPVKTDIQKSMGPNLSTLKPVHIPAANIENIVRFIEQTKRTYITHEHNEMVFDLGVGGFPGSLYRPANANPGDSGRSFAYDGRDRHGCCDRRGSHRYAPPANRD